MFTKQQLLECKLYDLREIGEQVGVKSPTNLKKADLIEEIWAIINGEKSKHVATRGRKAIPRLKEINISVDDADEKYQRKIGELLKENDTLKAEIESLQKKIEAIKNILGI